MGNLFTKNTKFLSLLIIFFALIALVWVLLFGNGSLGGGDDETAESVTSIVESPLARLGGAVQAGDPAGALTAACQLPAGDEAPILVAAHNAGAFTVTYRVEVELIDDRRSVVPGVATFTDLRPDETRYLVPLWSGELVSVVSCRILAIETDRSVVDVAD